MQKRKRQKRQKQGYKGLFLVLAFVLCLSLLTVGAAAADSDFTIENGVLTKYSGNGGDVVIPDGVTAIADGNKDHSVFGNRKSLTSITIPKSVTKIGACAFFNCTSLTNVTIPDSVTEIGERAFWYCSALTSATIPDGITEIKEGMFNHCKSLVHVDIPDSVTEIGGSVFGDCVSLTSIDIPDNVTEIHDSIFFNCLSLTSVTIPHGVTKFGKNAFYGCRQLTHIDIPNGVTEIGESAFGGCKRLVDVNIPDSVTKIGKKAFSDCQSLSSVVIPDAITEIDMGTFEGCASLTNVVFPKNITKIGYGAFQHCYSLTNVVIPDTVTEIGEWAFRNCKSLTSVTIPSSVTVIGNEAFYNPSNTVTLYSQTANITPQLYALVNHIPFVIGDAPAPSTQPVRLAQESMTVVTIDDKYDRFQMYALIDEKGGKTNYIRVRDLADALNGTAAQFAVGYDGKISLTAKTAYTPTGSEGKRQYSGLQPYKVNTNAIQINGQTVTFDSFVITDYDGGGHTYFKLRDLGKALGFYVGWSKEQGVYIRTDKPYSET